MWDVDAFTDAAGLALTPPHAKLRASGWPVCGEHDRVDVVVLPRWWAAASADAHEEARRRGYWEFVTPSAAVVASLARVGVFVAGAYFPDTSPGPDAFPLGPVRADVLRAIDAGDDGPSGSPPAAT